MPYTNIMQKFNVYNKAIKTENYINCRPYQKETIEHWITKAFLYKRFKDAGWDVLTEYSVSNNRKVDILVITQRNAFIIEVETNMRNMKKHKHIPYITLYPVQATLDLKKLEEKANNIITQQKNHIIY